MRVMILGSAAAEAIPDPFCQCVVCEEARKYGGRHLRSRSAALINDDLLIDLGPDFVSAANRLNLYLGRLSTVLITHRHEDHWLPSNLRWRDPGFAATPVAPLTVYGPASLREGLGPFLDRGAVLHFESVSGGDHWRTGDYEITAVPATHGGEELEALLYLVDDGQSCMLYATDTSLLGEAAWELLQSVGPLDLILLDATAGLRPGGSGHHGFREFIDTRARMVREGLAGPKTRFVAHHFSHNGGLAYPALVDKYKPYDVDVSYDGLTFYL